MAEAPAEWWRTFFDTAYVDAWEAEGAFAATDEEVRDLLALVSLDPGAEVLDVPCGFGRFAGPLHAAGFEVTGIDASEDQIRLAEERNPGPTYLVGDMREPPAGPFDAVLNLYSSFGYFDDPADDRRCLEAWRAVVRPGGVFLMETMHRDRLAWLWGQEHEAGSLREEGTTDWSTGVRTTRVEVAGEPRVFRVRLYTATELAAMLTDVGFVDVAVIGGLGGGELDPSTRLVLRAQG